MILLKTRRIVKSGLDENLVILCDKELIGKTLDRKIGFIVEPGFFKGEEKSENELLESLKDATIINAVGEESTGFLVKIGMISRQSIGKIGKTPHAQVFEIKQGNVF